MIKRLIFMVPLLFGITIICFSVMHLAPGSPTDLETQLNPRASADYRERLRSMYDLDKPLYEQYALWAGKLVRLDLGKSFSQDRRPVADKILERITITIAINVLSLILIIVIAIPIGVLSAVHRNSLFDKITGVFVFIGFAIPTFWLALLLMIFFGVNLGWLPISGIRSLNYEYLPPGMAFWDLIKHLIMPVTLSAFGGLAGLSRYMRSNMLEVIRQDYIMTARAKGLSERVVIYKHALRNALLPVITILGLSVPGLIGGSVIFETIFAIPGMGQLLVKAIISRDYMVVQGVVLVFSLATVAVNLLADVLTVALDPGVKL